MEKIVVEVGSTCTKVDLYDGNEIKHIKTVPIEFKKNYKENNKLKKEEDLKRSSYIYTLKEELITFQ